MNKVRFIRDTSAFKLEEEVNKIIKDKNIINISYSVAQCGYNYNHCCCILYREG